MENDQVPLPFHFFGHVWLEEPTRFLDEDEYEALQRYMPLIRTLESEWQRRPRPQWDLNSRFEGFVREETDAWRRRGAERPSQFLLRPSGSMTAPIAHHLLNPTFYAADPYTRETDDSSNPTIYLLHENGFSSENCFMFDQFARREDTLDCIRLWTDDVQKPHDDFVHELRQRMTAIVEICWGEVVWRRTKQRVQLIRFPLWGTYKDVKLYLELDEGGGRLSRFVFWVHHPQWFSRPNQPGTNSRVSGRAIQAGVQDAALGLAASLVDLSIKGRFYEHFPWGKYPRLTKEQRELRKDLVESAREELRDAFPIAAQEEEERRSRQEHRRKDERQQLRTILHALEKETYECPLENNEEHDDAELWELQKQQLQRLGESWLAVSQTIPHHNLGGLENPAVADSAWFDLPTELIGWLQAQDNLKTDGQAIESREELERCFRLLRCDEQTLQSGCIETRIIRELGLRVASEYTRFIIRKRRHVILELSVPGAPGEVIRRRCSSCGRRVLDDAFPLFAKKKRAAYVVRTLEIEGCGLPDCKGRVDLLPIDGWQSHIRGTRKILENPPNARGRGCFDTFLCRAKGELDGLPETVQTICMACGSPKLCRYARWTIEEEPRFVIPCLKCKGCGGSDRNFKPVDKLDTINSTVLSKFWTSVASGNFDPRDDPAVRRSFLGKANFATMKVALMQLMQQHQGDGNTAIPGQKQKRGNGDDA